MQDGFLIFDIFFFIAFTIFVIMFLYRRRKKVQVENKIFFLYRTKIGLKFMDNISKKFPKVLEIIGNISIGVGFLGMISAILMFALAVYQMAKMPIISNIPPVVPLVPWLQIPGLPMLYFTFWLIAIFIIASVHETAHGIFCRLYKVKVKSSGFGFVGPLPAAFVEPDEKQLQKKSIKKQLTVLSAGSFANLITAGIFFLIIFLAIQFTFPMISPTVMNASVQLTDVAKFSPAWNASLNKTAEGILELKNENTTAKTFLEISSFLNKVKPGEKITIKTTGKNFTKEINMTVGEYPKNKSLGYVGLAGKPIISNPLVNVWIWILQLLEWLFLINFFVGIFNLAPLPIFDGGRMFYLAMLKLTKNEKKAAILSKIMGSLLLTTILAIFIIWFIRI